MNAQLLLTLWRDIARHGETDAVLDRLRIHLADVLPLRGLTLRRFDRQQGWLDVVSMVGRRAGDGAMRITLTQQQQGDLLKWARGGQLCRAGDSVGAVVLEHRGASQSLAGPLMNHAGELLGIAIYHFKVGHEPSPAQRRMATELLEPMGVVLENDLRLREMKRLREALEADKRALLDRLDRQEIVETVIGAETGLRLVMNRVEQVAPADAPVLILGETGAGKEVIARAIHTRSARAGGPILRINCGAIPPELVDSELFGHEKGSFTGAVATRQGWFERADGGTLFLDEIGELPLAVQVRLLRILQDGTFERVGGQKPISVNVRVIAATHADLYAMVADGRFRQDLWYRISVFPIHLPPLRDRPDDIPAFASFFAARAGVRLGGHALVPGAGDIQLLRDYHWPGNVRELAAVIERAAILGNGRQLEIAQALGRSHSAAITSAGDAPAVGRPLTDAAANDTLDSAAVRHIHAALTACRGRIEGPFGAAQRLGINPHTLRSRMRKLGINWRAIRQNGSV